MRAISKESWRRYKKEYGIDEHDYRLMHMLQGGRCAICYMPEELIRKGLVVDHNHENGQVRGLLCGACNTGLGFFKDNQDSLAQAILYLKRFR